MSLVNKTNNLINKAPNILVVTGAGISVSAGIPDFRSKGGLYESVAKRFNLSDPTMIFNINYFMKDPTLFYEMSPELASNVEPTFTHKFIADLEKSHKVTVLTQNIDCLHQKAGSTNVIEAHGSYSKATCLNCGNKTENLRYDGSVLRCNLCEGLIKPDIVFFGENLPRVFFEFYEGWEDYNFDLMIIIGTGLEVFPVSDLVKQISFSLPNTIYITKRGNDMINTSVRVEEDIDSFFRRLVK